MMYMLDTCALIDMIFAPGRLSRRADEIIESDNGLCVSIASFWEIMVKQQIGKLDIAKTSAQELRDICEENGVEIVQTTVEEIDGIRTLPLYKDHGDPFDRLIICQARYRQLPLLTSDGKMKRYDIEVIW